MTTKVTQVSRSTTDITFDGWDWVLHTTQQVSVQIVSIRPVGLGINLVGNS